MNDLKNRLKEVEIDSANPFLHDALGREKYAKILTAVVDAYSSSGCVLAINGKWGAGKTTFVNMWKAYLDKRSYKTIYFNAWESDFMDDPLVALVSELQVLGANKESISEVAANVGKIILAAGISATKGFLKAKFGLDGDVIKDTIDQAKDVGLKCLDDYTEEKSTFETFRKNLVEFVADNAGEKPIVFFVDELDRCRPDYAVKVLERIKHLFDIPNVVFVLSINKKQLGYAIQGFYGSANIDAIDYLRRFIDIEYELPMPDMKEFTEYLYKEYGFDDFLMSKARLEYHRPGEESGELKSTASKFAEICQLDLRTQDRIFSLCRISMEAMRANNYLLPDVLYFLCLLKVKYSEIYSGMKDRIYSVPDLYSAIESSVFKNYNGNEKSDPYERNIEYTIATLLSNYNKPLYGIGVDSDFKEVDTGELGNKKFPLEIKKLNAKKVNEALHWAYNHSQEQYHMGLKFVMDRIDLLSPLISHE